MLRSRSAWPVSPGAFFSFLFILACCFLALPLGAKTRKPSPKPESKEDLGLKNIPLTVGHEAKGLVLPNYDTKGHLLGRFAAATASRIDDQHVHFSDLKMQTYDVHEKPDFNIDMTDAILNLDTRVLESKKRSTDQAHRFRNRGRLTHLQHRDSPRHPDGQRAHDDLRQIAAHRQTEIMKRTLAGFLFLALARVTLLHAQTATPAGTPSPTPGPHDPKLTTPNLCGRSLLRHRETNRNLHRARAGVRSAL